MSYPTEIKFGVHEKQSSQQSVKRTSPSPVLPVQTYSAWCDRRHFSSDLLDAAHVHNAHAGFVPFLRSVDFGQACIGKMQVKQDLAKTDRQCVISHRAFKLCAPLVCFSYLIRGSLHSQVVQPPRQLVESRISRRRCGAVRVEEHLVSVAHLPGCEFLLLSLGVELDVSTDAFAPVLSDALLRQCGWRCALPLRSSDQSSCGLDAHCSAV
jgi:hypothetical protein